MIRIREHAPNWPPVWTQTRIDGVKTVTGEVGELIYVYKADYSLSCYLVTKYENENYLGTLRFNDAIVCRLIAKLLQQQLGRSIKEIGDSNISFSQE